MTLHHCKLAEAARAASTAPPAVRAQPKKPGQKPAGEAKMVLRDGRPDPKGTGHLPDRPTPEVISMLKESVSVAWEGFSSTGWYRFATLGHDVDSYRIKRTAERKIVVRKRTRCGRVRLDSGTTLAWTWLSVHGRWNWVKLALRRAERRCDPPGLQRTRRGPEVRFPTAESVQAAGWRFRVSFHFAMRSRRDLPLAADDG